MGRGAVAAVGAVALLVVVGGGWLVVDARQRADEARQLADEAQRAADTAARQLDDLRAEGGDDAPPAGGSADPLSEALEGLLGDGGLDGLLGDGGLDGLLGDGGLDGLLGDGGLLECLGGAGAGGDLGSLFGGGGAQAPAGSVSEQIDAVTTSVADLRELDVREAVTPTFLDPDAFRDRVGTLFIEGYPPEIAEFDGRVLAALGAVPDGTDMQAMVRRALSEQAAGFYVPETGELVVSTAAGDDLDAITRVVLAHEIQHAIADQHFGLPEQQEPDPARTDADLAQLALIEGDATVTMQQYTLTNLSFTEQLGMVSDPSMLASQADLEELPHHLAQQLTFPYLDGMTFVCSLYSEGGWEAVNDAYASPPTTTAQVLFPERYGSEDAVDPGPAPGLPAPWTRGRAASFGAAELLWLLEAPGGDAARALDGARGAVAEWAGGGLTLFRRGGADAVALRLVDREGGAALCPTITDWARAAWPDAAVTPTDGDGVALDGDTRDVVVACAGPDVHVGIAPDVPTAESLAG